MLLGFFPSSLFFPMSCFVVHTHNYSNVSVADVAIAQCGASDDYIRENKAH